VDDEHAARRPAHPVRGIRVVDQCGEPGGVEVETFDRGTVAAVVG
jgi:hypothetical protein